MLNEVISKVTQAVIERSTVSRQAYLDKIRRAHRPGVSRGHLSCGNLAHGFAASDAHDKSALAIDRAANFAIVSSYNDMLSAHQPFQDYPTQIKEAARELGAVAQFAGGVPAMCDGVTQGREGMELSLFSRDNIAMATGVALSHDMFDGVFCLGVCDKIVPGLAIGALAFGHLPCVFVPAGPMESGLPNAEKSRIRQLYAEGKVGRKELLKAESESYHSAGTCTFYGTANSNQMLMEIMGMQLPGSSFVNPGTAMRKAMTRAAVAKLNQLSPLSPDYMPLGEMIDEKSIVNGIIGLLATGGSTNHTIHLVAIARAAGVIINWQDMAELSEVVPLLSRIYPNGLADVNHFQAAGGMPLLIKELLDNGLLHNDVATIAGEGGMRRYCDEPFITESGELEWLAGPSTSLDENIIASCQKPFSKEGGLRLLQGNLGRSVIKVSAVKEEYRVLQAPAVIFNDQDEIKVRFDAGDLDRDFIAVVRFQGPKANGMPELHKLTPILGVLQDRGYKVALVTDGRMSGASGKVPAAIHLTPEALDGGPIARLRDGDMIEFDAERSVLRFLDDSVLERDAAQYAGGHAEGMGRELFSCFRASVSNAESGASVIDM
ncbi:Phosphogluconate dehydratase [Zhongshania aliphaticivorans]|uniref:Phosphogluconate dehydratase n=1 Tax=Zhongshania aliphaticivorans TaxID=1470434 RepID=A0A5S9NJZ1_9GAMM|nr:phosphogluconate dehydratase [Zhongshania aliphaticivorans]CAA0090972.1 Phosphogluconate dehydratase [Zhongshania aliphaticivorans]CAA0098469.1 Phosphogluconate dehydratase [Zhongshania aliphaticivorans]